MLTVGEILKKEREKKGLTTDDIEKLLRVRKKFLTALEENNWDAFSSKIYIIGLLKSYAKVLNISSERLVAFFRREYEKKEDVQFKKRISSRFLTPASRRYFIAMLSGLVLFFLVYFGYQVSRFLTPPAVSILSPKTTTFRKTDRVQVIGKTEKEAVITIYGNRVYQDKDGIFKFDFPLKKGKNTFLIEVIGVNGKKTTVRREFYLSP